MLVAFSLLAAAGPLAAQSPAPQPAATPAPQPPESKPAGERVLNLQLDDASRRQIMRDQPVDPGAGRGAAGSLPSLGGDARPLDLTKPRESVFPKESTSKTPAPY
jgi:hypothetical protein